MADEIITLGDVTEYIELPPFQIEDWTYTIIPINELVKLDSDESLEIVRYSNDNSEFIIKYNSVSGSHPIGYENITTKVECNYEQIQDILTGSNWWIDNSDWEAETMITGSDDPEAEVQYWINPAYIGMGAEYVDVSPSSSME